MITTEYAATMARYNRWQNRSLYGAAETLDRAELDLDRGAFFRSIRETLNHLYWGDAIWMSRLNPEVSPPSAPSIADSVMEFETWEQLSTARSELDDKMLHWTGQLKEEDVTGDLKWYSKALGKEMSTPKGLCIVHVFNHQTHHRGQVHAMLTAAGAVPSDTDLPFMPENV